MLSHTDIPSSVTDSLFMATFVIGTLGLKAFYAAWTCEESDPIFKIEPTQRLRYSILTLAAIVCFAPTIYILGTNGWSLFTSGINKWWGVAPIGWVVGICMWFGLFSPIMTLLTAVHIYRHPCQMARRVSGGFIATRDMRAKSATRPVYEVEKFRTSDGKLHKRYVPSIYALQW